MSELSHGHESVPRERLEYGAVPLQPWQAKYPGREDVPYLVASLEHIDKKLTDAMEVAVKSGAIQSPERAQDIYEFLGASLYAAQTNRVDYSNDNALVFTRPYTQEVQNACDGLATPAELLGILKDDPQQRIQIGLAKLSHPFDFDASQPMDTAVRNLLRDPDTIQSRTAPRYRLKRRHEDLPLAIVQRKLDLADIPVEGGVIRVISRLTYLVRGDDEACDPEDVVLPRMIKNDHRFEDLTEYIEKMLSSEYFDAANKTLQPVTSSYYAVFIPAEQ